MGETEEGVMGKQREGGCVCGAVRYRMKAEPQIGVVCHCTWCQRRSGSAFAFMAYFNEADIEFLRGKMTMYEHRSDETGQWLRTEFCPACGTTVTHTIELRPGLRAIAAGTMDDPEGFRVDRHVWARSARPWVAIPVGVEEYETGSVGAGPVRRKR
jgi:hypothetical protein